MSLWRRIARLIQQSRIRLPRQPLAAAELRPGDWVQLGSQTWRVMTRRFEVERVVFRLRPLRGTAGAVLIGPSTTAGNWTLERSGSVISLPPDLLVVFSVAGGRWAGGVLPPWTVGGRALTRARGRV